MKKIKINSAVLFVVIAVFAKAQTLQIGTRAITYTDPARSNRSIQTEIYYPAATPGTNVAVSPGTFPIIVFGHGFVMAWSAYQNIWQDLVPQGYIVAFPKTEGSMSPSHAAFGADLAFLITKLQSEGATNPSSPFYNHINSKLAIMGHSMGAGSAFLAAKNNTGITTMVSLAAANTTPSSITAAQNITVPCLVFAAENDCVAPPSAHQLKMYDSLASSCKTYISINGGAHCEFADYNFNCSFGQTTCSPQPTISGTQQQVVVSDFIKLWFDYYLKDDCNAWDLFNDSLISSTRITHDQTCQIYNPVINQNAAVLQSSPATTYQWYLNGSVINGATFQNYTPNQSGSYYVEATYYTACPYTSNSINVSTTGIFVNSITKGLKIYPNPATNELTIEYSANANGDVKLKIRNIVGQNVMEKKYNAVANNVSSENINISELPNGIYLMELSAGNFRYVEKLIKY